MSIRRATLACLTVGILLALYAVVHVALKPSPWPQRITDDMTAVQTNETSLAINPADTTAYRECLDHVAAYNADTAHAPGWIPAGMPESMLPADACGHAPKPTTPTRSA